MMKIQLLQNRRRRRQLGAAAILAALIGLWAGAQMDRQNQRAAWIANRTDQMSTRADLMQATFLEEEEKLNRLLLRIRSDLRTEGSWARDEIADTQRSLLSAEAEAGAETADEVAVKVGVAGASERWKAIRSLLQDVLKERGDLASLDFVVVDQAGLTAMRLIRTDQGVTEVFEDPRAEKGLAKAVWYSDDVRRAVKANGRKVTRGPFSVSGVGASKQTEMPVAVGIHGPSDLVQAVLRANFDISGTADALIASDAAGISARVVSLDGRGLTSGPPQAGGSEIAALESSMKRDALLAERVVVAAPDEGAFQLDQRLVRGVVLKQADGRVSEAIGLLESALPAPGLLPWMMTGKGIVVLGLTLLGVGGMVFLLRPDRPRVRQDAKKPVANEERVGKTVQERPAPEEAADPSQKADGLKLDPQKILLREWLADVRGCLEREAALRGLSLNLRCERSMPQWIEQDPGWLGGLVLAMGQEALDATGEDRVLVRVREDTHEVMRIEVDAGTTDLSPVQGMLKVGEEMGGRFEVEQPGRLAFVLPMSAGMA